MSLERLCLFCEEFSLSTGDRGYSEYTPSSPAFVKCDADHWEMEKGVGDSEPSYRRCLLQGLICPDFKLAEMPWLSPELRKLLEGEEDVT